MPGFGPVASGPVGTVSSQNPLSTDNQQVTSITGYTQIGAPDATQQVTSITSYTQIGAPDATQQIMSITGYTMIQLPLSPTNRRRQIVNT